MTWWTAGGPVKKEASAKMATKPFLERIHHAPWTNGVPPVPHQTSLLHRLTAAEQRVGGATGSIDTLAAGKCEEGARDQDTADVLFLAHVYLLAFFPPSLPPSHISPISHTTPQADLNSSQFF